MQNEEELKAHPLVKKLNSVLDEISQEGIAHLAIVAVFCDEGVNLSRSRNLNMLQTVFAIKVLKEEVNENKDKIWSCIHSIE